MGAFTYDVCSNLGGFPKAECGRGMEPCWRQQRSLFKNKSLKQKLINSQFTTADIKCCVEEISITIIYRGNSDEPELGERGWIENPRFWRTSFVDDYLA